MVEDAQNQILATCEEFELTVVSCEIDQDVLVLELATLPSIDQSQASADALKALGYRWVAFEVAQ